MTNWLSSVVAGEDADGDILSLLAGVVSPKGSRLDRNYRTDCSAAWTHARIRLWGLSCALLRGRGGSTSSFYIVGVHCFSVAIAGRTQSVRAQGRRSSAQSVMAAVSQRRHRALSVSRLGAPRLSAKELAARGPRLAFGSEWAVAARDAVHPEIIAANHHGRAGVQAATAHVRFRAAKLPMFFGKSASR